jgi:hypothetical protein
MAHGLEIHDDKLRVLGTGQDALDVIAVHDQAVAGGALPPLRHRTVSPPT